MGPERHVARAADHAHESEVLLHGARQLRDAAALDGWTGDGIERNAGGPHVVVERAPQITTERSQDGSHTEPHPGCWRDRAPRRAAHPGGLRLSAMDPSQLAASGTRSSSRPDVAVTLAGYLDRTARVVPVTTLRSSSSVPGVVVLASVASAVLNGVEGRTVVVEVHVSRGLPAYSVVGLPDAAVRESRERVRAAFCSSGLAWPLTRITVNLAPGGVRKSGSGLEVAVALGLLVAGGDLPSGALDGVGVLGELGLDGSVRAIPGTLALVDALVRIGITTIVCPIENAEEASLVPGVTVHPARTLFELRDCMKGEAPWPGVPESSDMPEDPDDDADLGAVDSVDLGEVRGLSSARTALELAAAGSHHVLLVGPPGAGKTMLARRFGTILPPLEPDEALEVTRIHSAAGVRIRGGLARRRPFCAPHHTVSPAALVGGGTGRPSPGEVTLAHRGALFLDELGEFPARALEALRQPLEEGSVRISRQPTTITFPAQFILVACSNPCPCGLSDSRCHCSDAQKARYRRRLSPPLLDRFDLRLRVGATRADIPPGESSATVAARVTAAVARQLHRFRNQAWRRNAHVPAGALDEMLPFSDDAREAWVAVCEEQMLTGRGAAIVRRVAATAADLDDVPTIRPEHLVLAAAFRQDVP